MHEEIHHNNKIIETELSEIHNLIHIAILEKEIEAMNKSEKETYDCTFCDFKAKTTQEKKTHIQTTHQLIKVNVEKTSKTSIICLKCEKTFGLNIQLKKHLDNEHKEDQLITCNICQKSFCNSSELCDQILASHVGKPREFAKPQLGTENELLAVIANQNSEMLEAFVDFRNGVKEIIGKLIEEHEESTNSLRKEAVDNQKKTEALICKLEEKIENNKIKQPSKHSSVELKPSVTKASNPSTFKAQNTVDTGFKDTRPKKPHVLFVGDSVAHHNNFRKLEIATKQQSKQRKHIVQLKTKMQDIQNRTLQTLLKMSLTRSPMIILYWLHQQWIYQT